jgi:carbon monoxide dehydrogenase subunit G
MTTSSATRSIEIEAPVEDVFAFIADPHRRMQAQERVFGRHIVVRDVETSPEGTITGCKVSTRFPPLPIDITLKVARLEHVPNERMVDRALNLTKDLDEFTVEPTQTGTRLTWHAECSSPIPYLEKLGALLSARKSYEGQLDDNLAEIKRELENSPDSHPSQPPG